ncbi:UbiA family prenyltransferase [Rufibacter quisquiliarum]|uniref:1,4-dihydroxy-2-naphthoate octaprenyltransferase n=1 Tax=Rufibacter quisquiliarum TaxID=1549639 RepID=A0A839GIN9_9BACT|nr:UbiA family prenyltransferase [Rufibacter quisquiliarum]MBA9075475.1 1,4-dihydroxy-2-naphthoate octaprenyltransferase [Rufibacter quisquiliarum]
MTSSLTNALRLLRIPFSLFLMPIYWFALSAAPQVEPWRAAAVFLILHLLVYPASNGYNSYYDRDEGSIGGLKHPPQVTEALYWLVLAFDGLAVVLSALLSLPFAGMVALYLLISKAYSYKGIRLKKYPLLSTLVVVLFQGGFTFAMVQVGSGVEPGTILSGPNLLLALVSTLFLCGSYPLTQVYQHDEDARRGDRTLSLQLGLWGTFLFAGVSLAVAAGLLLYTYWLRNELYHGLFFLLCTFPVVVFFTRWLWKVKKDTAAADFDHTMRMNKISSLSMSLAFILMLVW